MIPALGLSEIAGGPRFDLGLRPFLLHFYGSTPTDHVFATEEQASHCGGMDFWSITWHMGTGSETMFLEVTSIGCLRQTRLVPLIE